jgi:hypothetical protein
MGPIQWDSLAHRCTPVDTLTRCIQGIDHPQVIFVILFIFIYLFIYLFIISFFFFMLYVFSTIITESYIILPAFTLSLHPAS